MNEQIDAYFNDANLWKEILPALRQVVLARGLTEDWKWGTPCYSLSGKNVVMISAFKAYCCVSFFKGALLKDEEGVLSKPGENTQAVRILKFTHADQMPTNIPFLQNFLHQAIALEKAGVQVEMAQPNDLALVEELVQKLANDDTFKQAFEALTPGRQRGYNLYFSAAKQAVSRIKRIQTYEARILSGKGINDCVCGLSKRMPGCDGSHKFMGQNGK